MPGDSFWLDGSAQEDPCPVRPNTQSNPSLPNRGSAATTCVLAAGGTIRRPIVGPVTPGSLAEGIAAALTRRLREREYRT